MDKNFNKARTQGILGAVCILCANASFLVSDQSLFWIVRTLTLNFINLKPKPPKEKNG